MTATVLMLLSSFIFSSFCFETDSAEVNNNLEFTPYYEAIIVSDIADILNEFKGKEKFPNLLPVVSGDDESEEDIEELLSEYQHYLDKAHKQTVTYFESPKAKNKVPRVRHDRFSKVKTLLPTGHQNHYKSVLPSSGFPLLNNPKNMLMSILTKNNDIGENKMINKPFPTFRKEFLEPIKPSCICKNDQFPCECECQKCLFSWELKSFNQNKMMPYDEDFLNPQFPVFVENSIKNPDIKDNTFNIHIKLDLQVPKHECCKNNSCETKNEGSPDALASTITVPFPYFNLPFPIELFSMKKKHESFSPLHKITVHKKRKNRNNSNKKHRKKFITFHNINLESQNDPTMAPIIEDNNMTIKFFTDANKSTTFDQDLEKTIDLKFNDTVSTYDIDLKGDIEQPHVEKKLLFNLSKTDNMLDDTRKIPNSIETELSTLSNSTEKILEKRVKRETNTTNDVKEVIRTSKKTTDGKILKEYKHKKSEKDVSDSELLYWPNNLNITAVKNAKNITALILDRESNKAKLNATKEVIRNNHTKILEQAIFGAVDWDDVDTVAPVFISFVGKYMTGVLTFCSQTICHSMKCAEKICLHRSCLPIDRYLQRGHCIGSNSTDSIVTMESIMDLPSNIGFEIVDILQDKLLGKLYGKITLCMSSKCITFAASKKLFLKWKCLVKDLNSLGQCQNAKNIKMA